jgi:hypothetical protein
MVNAVNGSSTVNKPRTGRRVVRRGEGTLDQAWSTVLADLPPEMRPAMRAYVEAKRAEFDARDALSTLATRHGVRWYQLNNLAQKLAF